MGTQLFTHAGFSTLELLIAFSIMTLSMTAVIMVALGNQSTAIDTQLAQKGLYIAKLKLEETIARMENDFDAVTSDNIATSYNAVFDTRGVQFDISECAKRIESEAFWNRDLRYLENSFARIEISPVISLALRGDCDTEEVSNWQSPRWYENSDPIPEESTANDVDVIKNSKGSFAILTSNKVPTHETVWVMDVTDPDEPLTIGSFDTGNDVNAVDAHFVGDSIYAFIATASTSAQLQIIAIDLSLYPNTSPTPVRIGKASLPQVSGAQPQGRALTFYDNKVYIGTRRTAGNEFHIFSVANLFSPLHLGSLELNHSVNEIDIRNDHAFIASTAQTTQGCELIVLDVSSPARLENPCSPGSESGVMNFRAPGNFGATTLEAFGGKVYLGRQRSAANNDFYVLDTNDLMAIFSLGSANLNINAGTEVVGLKVSGNLAFIATSDTTPANGGGPFLIYDINNPTTLVQRPLCSTNFSEGSTGMDLFEDSLYITNTTHTALRIFYPALSCS